MSDPKFPPPTGNDTDTKHPPPDRVEKQQEQQSTTQNDRAASNQSGMGSNSGQRDMTSGRHSGNQ